MVARPPLQATLNPRAPATPEAIFPLVARTTRIQATSPFDFLDQFEGSPRFLYWHNGAGVAGAGIAAEIQAPGPQRFEAVRAWATQQTRRLRPERAVGVPDAVGPRFLGGASFVPDEPTSIAFGGAYFVLPHHQLIIDAQGAYLTETAPEAPSPAESRIRSPTRAPLGPPTRPAWTHAPNFQEWTTAVRGALHAVREGAAEKVVLARTMTTQLPQTPTPTRWLRRLAERSPTSRLFLFEPEPGRAFLGASPELLVRRAEGRFQTVAIAGSRPRGLLPREDASLERALLASSKDAWEHELVCRFLRGVLVERGQPWSMPVERRVAKFPNVQHLESQFESSSGPEEHLLDLAARLHPTPAVAGYPRNAAMDLIRRLEARPRGWYAGPIGWFDERGDGELAVAIRCGRVQDRTVTLYAGCGIVNGSDPAEEWEESRSKFQLLQEAIEAEEGS